MRVCFLTHYFPPEVGAPQTRIDLIARTLAASGATVTVHTGFPHYPSGAIPVPYRNRPWQRERRDGIRIVRSAVYPAANRGFVPRIADHTAFAASALATARLSGAQDVVVGETPPLFTAAAGVLYARAKRAAYVPHVADLWPASAVELGALRNRRAIAAAEAIERWVYRSADLIVAPTDGIIRALEAAPDAAGRTRRVWPVIDTGRFSASAPLPGGPLRLLYAGTIGLAQGLEVLVEASRLAGPEIVQTTIAGDGADRPRLLQLIDAQRVSNVRLLGAVPAVAVPALYRDADAAAVLLRDLPIFDGALPTKLFEAMAAGRPLLLSARGESAQLVREMGAGLVVTPGDPAALADGLRTLHADPARRAQLGAAGRAAALQRFGTGPAGAQWSALLSDAVRSRRNGRAAAARYPTG